MSVAMVVSLRELVGRDEAVATRRDQSNDYMLSGQVYYCVVMF